MDLHTLFNCFIVGGFVVPVLNMVTGVIGGALGGGTDLDADADFDIDPYPQSVLPSAPSAAR